MTWKKFIKALMWLSLVGFGMILFANVLVIATTRSAMKSDINDLKPTRVALVLGTSKSTSEGNKNLFFKDRMRAAAQLYKAGKVKHLLVSGDNRSQYYNEPRDMLRALQELGVPSEDITLDFAGLRTLDSVVRCKEIFDQHEVIIVTQQFHAARALFISDYYDLDAQAYLANFESKTFPMLIAREIVARTLSVFDLYVFGKGPRHLGNKEPLNTK